MGHNLPPEVRPGSVRSLRKRLKATWENQHKPVPPDLCRWPRARLVAAWYEVLRRAGFHTTERSPHPFPLPKGEGV